MWFNLLFILMENTNTTNPVSPLPNSSATSDEKNPFAELSEELSHGAGALPKVHTSRMALIANISRIFASLAVAVVALLAFDVFVRSSLVTPNFIPASLANYMALGVRGESNPGNLSVAGLKTKYETDTQALLAEYDAEVSMFAYKRGLIEFFDKNPEVVFIKSNTQNRYNVFAMIKAFEDLTKWTNYQITYNCKILNLSDNGDLKWSCDILSPTKLSNSDAVSSRVAALEFIDSIESPSSLFRLKNPPKNVPLEILKEGGTQSHLDLDLQALPLLMP